MGKKIVIIESNKTFGKELSEFLSSKGYHVQSEPDALVGLELVKSQLPDAIILCVELDKISGYSICNKIRKSDSVKTTPLILMSADATEDTFEQHQKMPTRANAYLKKPFEYSELLTILNGFFETEITYPEPVKNTLENEASFKAKRRSFQGTMSQKEIELEINQPQNIEISEDSFVEEISFDDVHDHRPGANLPNAFSEEDNISLESSEPKKAPAPIDAPIAAPIPTPKPLEAARSNPLVESSFKLDEPAEPFVETAPPAPISREPTPLPQMKGRGDEILGTQVVRLKDENHRLRQKVQHLQTDLQDKDSEFADRLMQESSRARSAIELKQKLSQLEKILTKEREKATSADLQSEELMLKLSETEAEKIKYHSELKSLQIKNDDLELKAQQYNTEIEVLKTKLSEQITEITQLRNLMHETEEKSSKNHDTLEKVKLWLNEQEMSA